MRPRRPPPAIAHPGRIKPRLHISTLPAGFSGHGGGAAFFEGGSDGGGFGSFPTDGGVGGGIGGRGSGCSSIIIVVLFTLAVAAVIVWALRDVLPLDR